MRKNKRKSISWVSLLLILLLVILAVFVWKNYSQFLHSSLDISAFFPPSLSDLGSSIGSGLGKFGGH